MRRVHLAFAAFVGLAITSNVVAQTSRQSHTTLVLVPAAGGASPNDFLIRNKSANEKPRAEARG
jgi:hypothetical protein